MANYDDPFYRSQGVDAQRTRDPRTSAPELQAPPPERGSGLGILIGILAVFVFLGLLFAFAGGTGEGEDAVPGAPQATEQPATPDPVAPDGTLQ